MAVDRPRKSRGIAGHPNTLAQRNDRPPGMEGGAQVVKLFVAGAYTSRSA
jgi:hypothetical protein